MLFAFARTKIDKHVIAASAKVIKKVFYFYLRHRLLCIKEILECVLSLLLVLLVFLLSLLLD